MSTSTTKRKLFLDENVVAAHETLEDAAAKVGKAASVLMRRVEELTGELSELQARYDRETDAAKVRYSNDMAAAEKTRETELQALRIEFAKKEAEMKTSNAELEQKVTSLQEKLRKVQATLS